MGEKKIPMGAIIGPQPLKKWRFKFTTKRPREEELAQIKGDITVKQPPKKVCIQEVEQTQDSYLKLVNLHKEGKQVVEEEEGEEEESPLCKKLQTKQRGDPTFLRITNLEPTIGMSHLQITSPTSPSTQIVGNLEI